MYRYNFSLCNFFFGHPCQFLNNDKSYRTGDFNFQMPILLEEIILLHEGYLNFSLAEIVSAKTLK